MHNLGDTELDKQIAVLGQQLEQAQNAAALTGSELEQATALQVSLDEMLKDHPRPDCPRWVNDQNVRWYFACKAAGVPTRLIPFKPDASQDDTNASEDNPGAPQEKLPAEWLKQNIWLKRLSSVPAEIMDQGAGEVADAVWKNNSSNEYAYGDWVMAVILFVMGVLSVVLLFPAMIAAPFLVSNKKCEEWGESIKAILDWEGPPQPAPEGMAQFEAWVGDWDNYRRVSQMIIDNHGNINNLAAKSGAEKQVIANLEINQMQLLSRQIALNTNLESADLDLMRARLAANIQNGAIISGAQPDPAAPLPLGQNGAPEIMGN